MSTVFLTQDINTPWPWQHARLGPGLHADV